MLKVIDLLGDECYSVLNLGGGVLTYLELGSEFLTINLVDR